MIAKQKLNCLDFTKHYEVQIGLVGDGREPVFVVVHRKSKTRLADFKINKDGVIKLGAMVSEELERKLNPTLEPGEVPHGSLGFAFKDVYAMQLWLLNDIDLAQKIKGRNDVVVCKCKLPKAMDV